MHIHMQKTRQEIVEILKRRGEATVEELSSQLALTPTCIRQHVAVLERDGLIDSREVRRKVGRPHYVFRLTAQADAVFPQHYDLLASFMLDDAKQRGGTEEVQALVRTLAERLANHFESRVRAGSFTQSVENLVGVLDELGVMPEAQGGAALVPPQRGSVVGAGAADSGGDSSATSYYSDDAVIIRENNCAFRRVSLEHPELCDLTQLFIARVLNADVQRLDEGSSEGNEPQPRTYRISPRSGLTANERLSGKARA